MPVTPSHPDHADPTPKPPPRVSRRGRLDRGEVLAECPGDTGLVLWRAVRAVALWAECPAPERARLFAPAAGERLRAQAAGVEADPAVAAALEAVAALMDRPGAAAADPLVQACRALSEWAEQRGWMATAFEFAQGAAYLAPDSALAAYLAGRLARRLAEHGLAESWFDYALALARRSRDWRSYALACSGSGNLHYQSGNLVRSRYFHLRALRAARRHSLRQNEAEALHDLFLLSAEMGLPAEAEEYATQAVAAYGPKHYKLPRLAYDVAYFRILNGRFDEALRIALALRQHFSAPAERILVESEIARAAGCAGNRVIHAHAREQIEALARDPGARDCVAGALLGLAYGAAGLEDWKAAASLAREVVAVAEERSQSRHLIEADRLLELCAARSRAAAARTFAKVFEPEPLTDELVCVLDAGAGAPGSGGAGSRRLISSPSPFPDLPSRR